MKTIGLIGGMSWESTVEYYRLLNEGIKSHLGGLHSARCLLWSVDFAEIEELQVRGKWDQAAYFLADAGRVLENGGADCLVLCTNTMHKVANEIQAAIQIPLIHIADATARQIQAQGMKRIGLLGTRFTMEESFYKGRLTDFYDLEVLIPDSPDREFIHHVIYDELCLGIIKNESRQRFTEIIHKLHISGAEGIILGCTEIGLLVKQGDSQVALFNTTLIHVRAVVEFALK